MNPNQLLWLRSSLSVVERKSSKWKCFYEKTMFKKYIDPSTLLDILCFKVSGKHNYFFMKRKTKKLFGCPIKQQFTILRKKIYLLYGSWLLNTDLELLWFRTRNMGEMSFVKESIFWNYSVSDHLVLRVLFCLFSFLFHLFLFPP